MSHRVLGGAATGCTTKTAQQAREHPSPTDPCDAARLVQDPRIGRPSGPTSSKNRAFPGRLLGVDFESLQLAGRPVAECLTELLERLRDLKDAVANRDHVLLADILRYEFDDVLQRWERMLDGFIDHVEALPDDAGCAPGA